MFQILQAKINRMEHLIHLKDVRIDDLQNRVETMRPTGNLVRRWSAGKHPPPPTHPHNNYIIHTGQIAELVLTHFFRTFFHFLGCFPKNVWIISHHLIEILVQFYTQRNPTYIYMYEEFSVPSSKLCSPHWSVILYQVHCLCLLDVLWHILDVS